MTAEDLDPLFFNLCRQLASTGDENLIDDSDDSDDGLYINSSLEDDNNTVEDSKDYNELSLISLSLSEYSRDKLLLLSKSLGKSNLCYLEIEVVLGLDWSIILTQESCTLDEVCITIQSQHAFEAFSEALCCNTSLSSIEIECCYPDNDNREEEEIGYNVDNTELESIYTFPRSLHETLFKGLMPLESVILRGISPQISSSFSTSLDEQDSVTTCSWRYLTIEDCTLTSDIAAWLSFCINNLQKLVLTNCQLSDATIKVLSEEYLALAVTDNQNSFRKSDGGAKTKKLRKNPLQILDLSNNVWLLSSEEGKAELDKENLRYNKGENEGFDNCIRPLERRGRLPPPSCMTFLSSWLDSLSNLVELNLSNSPEIFHNCRNTENFNGGMFDLCKTVNHSLRRFSVRQCQLIPSDLQHMVDTFCWLEALDLSENPALISDLSSLTQLEHLTEIVLENMFVSNMNEFQRLTCDGNIDGDADERGIGEFLFELANEESCSNHHWTTTGTGKQRRRPLERLNLSGNIVTKRTLKILPMFTSLKVLILIGCQISGEGLIELLGGTIPSNNKQPSSLREIYLASNIIGDIGALTLARSMKEQYLPSLRTLHMESNVISVNAFRVFVEDGLVHSRRLESVEVWDDGAITSSQQDDWNELDQTMQHYLLLNKAGRFALFVDGDYGVDHKQKDSANMNTKNNTSGSNGIDDNKVSTNLWPIILEDADLVYGADAIYYFLHKRPDLILGSQQPQIANEHHSVSFKATPQSISPNGIAETDALFLKSIF